MSLGKNNHNRTSFWAVFLVLACCGDRVTAFVPGTAMNKIIVNRAATIPERLLTIIPTHQQQLQATTTTATTSNSETDRQLLLATRKNELVQLLERAISADSRDDSLSDFDILVNPFTQEPLTVETKVSPSSSKTGGSTLFGDQLLMNQKQQSAAKNLMYTLATANPANSSTSTSAPQTFRGSAQTYLNLLEYADSSSSSSSSSSDSSSGSSAPNPLQQIVRTASPWIPVPIRSTVASLLSAAAPATAQAVESYIPMRDLFTSPAVSNVYERGWRQSFASSGFPGPAREAQMAMDYFAPCYTTATANDEQKMLVDMSCATGILTRQFQNSNRYNLIWGCDYSDSMLQQATANNNAATTSSSTRIRWLRLDVARLPFASDSLPALHAGAAMHCWPELAASVQEIYRVLRPNGGRYFATTFLKNPFFGARAGTGGALAPDDVSREAFHFFESKEELKDLLVQAGFAPEKVQIEVLAPACAVIRAEK